jgi:hypothetical protein
MDPVSISKTVGDLTAILMPLIPYLISGAKSASEEFVSTIGKGTGEKVLTLAKSLWESLQPKLEDNPQSNETLKKVASQPNNPQTIQAVSELFKDALKDPQVKKDIQQLLRQDHQRDSTIKAALRIGKVYGKVVGIEITNMKSLKTAGVVANIKVGTVGKGGKVTGMVIGIAGDPTTDAPKPVNRK